MNAKRIIHHTSFHLWIKFSIEWLQPLTLPWLVCLYFIFFSLLACIFVVVIVIEVCEISLIICGIMLKHIFADSLFRAFKSINILILILEFSLFISSHCCIIPCRHQNNQNFIGFFFPEMEKFRTELTYCESPFYASPINSLMTMTTTSMKTVANNSHVETYPPICYESLLRSRFFLLLFFCTLRLQLRSFLIICVDAVFSLSSTTFHRVING